MNRQPLLILVCCFILGILFQDYFFFSKNIVFYVFGSFLFIFGLAFLKSFYLQKLKPVFLSIFFFGLGISLHRINQPDEPGLSLNSNQMVIFKIVKKLNSNEKYKKYEVEMQADREVFNSVLFILKEQQELDFKHYYKAEAFISRPKSPEHEFQFDYSKYLHRKNIFHQSYIVGEISSAVRNDVSFTEKIREKRLHVLKKINQSEMSPRSQEFLKGIILADRTEIDSETLQDFNRSGLVHFLAISGTHVVVIFGLFYFLLLKILPLGFRKSSIVISLIFIWMFAFFIGFGNSVVRSCIMLSVYFVYVLLQRKPDLLHAVALSAFVILSSDTQQLFDVGFQLSFLAVLGIFWLNQPILKHLPRQDNLIKKVMYNTVSISVSAQLATLPLVLFYFHQFSFISIVANFFIVPFSEVIIIFSFAMVGLIALGIDFGIINWVYDSVISVLLKVIHWFADFDVLFFENIPMNMIEVAVLFIVIYLSRFPIIKYSFRKFTQWSLAILMFFTVKISSDIYENRKNEILVFHYRKSIIVSAKKGSQVCFWTENKKDRDKIKQYIINPYLSSARAKNVQIKVLPPSAEKVVFNHKIYDLK